MKNVLRLLLPLSLALSLFAQDVAPGGGRGGETFPAPKEEDTLFVVDEGSGLDTSCTFRSGGPLMIHLPVRRYVGEVDGNGSLSKYGTLVSEGVLSATAKLRMPVYDVDTVGNPDRPFEPPEVDRVYLNDHYIGDLSGVTDEWKQNQFTFQSDWIKYPALGGAPADNVIRIEIDTKNTDVQAWCTAVDWAELQFAAVAPVFLVHGLFSAGSKWPAAFSAAFEARHIPVSNRIDLPGAGSIRGNGHALARALHAEAERFGAKKCHIVAHSKGGLDTRAYLNGDYDPNELKVQSVYTLSTPHRGTPVADLGVILSVVVLRSSAALKLIRNLFPAIEDLTTLNLFAFNLRYPGTAGVPFTSYGADADLDHNNLISVAEAKDLDPNATVAAVWGTLTYNFIGQGERAIVITVTPDEWGENFFPDIDLSITDFVKNDTLVSERSASWGNYVRTEAANHSTIKSADLAARIANDIKNKSSVHLNAVEEPAPQETMPTSVVRDSFQLTPASRTRTYNVTIDRTPSATLFVIAASQTLSVIATAPGGATYTGALMPLENEGTTGGAYFATVTNPIPGTWSMTVTESAQLAAPLDVVSAVMLGNAVQSLLVDGADTFPLGKKIRLAFVVFDGTRRLTGLTIAALLRNPDDAAFAPVPITFRDDGADADTKAGDGIYEAFVTPPTAGNFAVRVEGAGTASTGAFRRSAAAELRVVPRDAEILGFDDFGEDEDFDGLDDRIVIMPSAMLATAGNYEIFVRLRASNGKEILRSTTGTFAAGRAEAGIPFSADAIATDFGVDGPYTVAEVRFSHLVGDEPVPADIRYDLGQTYAYKLSALQHARIRLTGTGVAKGIDNAGEGRYDLLEVQLGVVVETAGPYSWSVSLRDRNGREISFINGEIDFDEGANTLQLLFPGEAIARNGVHGPYYVTNLVMYGQGQSLVVNDAFTTPAFSAHDFGQPSRRHTVRH